MTGGTPRKLHEDATYGADWHPDGRTLAIFTWQGGRSRLEMPPGRGLYETTGTILARVRVSPDGRYVALMEWPVSQRWRLVVVDTTGRVRARSRQWRFGSNAAWSADGREVWFSVGDDNSMTELRAMTPEGRERLIARLPGRMGLCDVARDGRVLLVRSTSRSGIRGWHAPRDDGLELGWFDQSQLADLSDDGRVLLLSDSGPFGGPYSAVCLRGMDGSPAARLGEGRAQSLSPDGKWALALQLREPSRVVLLPTGAGDSLVLPRGRIEKYLAARFMPDGKSILFIGAEPGMGTRSYVQGIHDAAPHAVTPEHIEGELVSPDGRRIVYRDGGQLYVSHLGADDAEAVGEVSPGESLVQWAADGRRLYVAQADSTIRIYRLDLETGKRVPWKTVSFADRAGLRFVNSNVKISPNGETYAVSYERVQSDLYLLEGLK